MSRGSGVSRRRLDVASAVSLTFCCCCWRRARLVMAFCLLTAYMYSLNCIAVWALIERACAVCTLYEPAPATKLPMPEAMLHCTVEHIPPQPPQPTYRTYCA